MSKMKKLKSKVTKTSFFWIYYILSVFLIVVSILFAPFWKEINKDIVFSNWYKYALGVMLAITILFYVFLVLLKRIKSKGQHKTVRIIMGIEFSFLILLALFCVLKAVLIDNNKFQFFNTLEIVSIIMWIRGFVEIINAYYYDKKTNQKYPIWFLVLNVMLISIGPMLFMVGIKYNKYVDLFVSYTFCSILLFFGCFSFIMGILTKPIKIEEEPVLCEEIITDEDVNENPIESTNNHFENDDAAIEIDDNSLLENNNNDHKNNKLDNDNNKK